MKTSDAAIGSKHNAGIATASSARFEIHFIYPVSEVMLSLLVIFAFSFGAACCFRFIPVFWVHVFACIRFVFFSLGTSSGFHVGFWVCMYLVGVFFPLGPRSAFISFGGILCFFQFAVVTFLIFSSFLFRVNEAF